MQNWHNANIVAVMGGSGSGKSAFIKQEIKRLKPNRLIIFDVMHEYGHFGDVANTCLQAAKIVKKNSFKLIFQPSSAAINSQFEFICKLAFSLEFCMLIVEELNRVTQPTSAPPAWRDCTSRGRHKGMIIFGASQHPASVDKDFFGNATTIRTGRLNYAAHIKTMANILKVKNSEIDTLLPLEFIERDMNTGETVRGKLSFSRKLSSSK